METLYKQFKIYEEIVTLYCEKEKTLELSAESEIAPTTLAALLCFMENNEVKKFKLHPKLKKLHKNIIKHNEISDRGPAELPIKRSEWFEVMIFLSL